MTKQIALIMNVGMMSFFLILAMIFALLKEKACFLISGYNFKSKKEREKYDELQMSKDMRNFWFICSGIFFIGAIGILLFGNVFVWISFLIWGIYFFKNVHVDNEKAFGKYKKN